MRSESPEMKTQLRLELYDHQKKALLFLLQTFGVLPYEGQEAADGK